jgi:hypothetical protein
MKNLERILPSEKKIYNYIFLMKNEKEKIWTEQRQITSWMEKN